MFQTLVGGASTYRQLLWPMGSGSSRIASPRETADAFIDSALQNGQVVVRQVPSRTLFPVSIWIPLSEWRILHVL